MSMRWQGMVIVAAISRPVLVAATKILRLAARKLSRSCLPVSREKARMRDVIKIWFVKHAFCSLFTA